MLIGQSVCNCLLIFAAGVELDNFVSIHILLIRCQYAKCVGVKVILVFAMTRVGRRDLGCNSSMKKKQV